MRAALHAPALVEKIERVLNLAFCEGVERRGCLVENEDRRRLQNGSGDRDALLFAAREFQSAFADLRLVTARNMFDEMIDPRQARRLPDLGVARVEAAVADI